MMEGVLAIAEGLNPRLIEEKLRAFLYRAEPQKAAGGPGTPEGRMRRRRRTSDHVNTERWLISYADFITLLFAFFVTMYAISTVDQRKLQKGRRGVPGRLRGFTPDRRRPGEPADGGGDRRGGSRWRWVARRDRDTADGAPPSDRREPCRGDAGPARASSCRYARPATSRSAARS
jgi:hypothetical protein